MKLEGLSALVTGASRGIGRTTALRLAARGLKVACFARDREALDAVVAEIGAHGGSAIACVGDVRDGASCTAAVAATVAAHGSLQVLVNNAGVGGRAPLADTTDEQWDAILGTNLTGVFRLTRAALPHLARRGGHIFMISSLAGRNPIAGLSAYCASKAALDHLAACLMLEVRHQGIKVTTIAPGSVDTTFGDAAGLAGGDGSWMLTAEDVADAVVSLLETRDDAHLSRVEMRPLRPKSR
jgi:NAD(P)-dependent dehydrogenase (short-subunit alcohol dehydrogenase family)